MINIWHYTSINIIFSYTFFPWGYKQSDLRIWWKMRQQIQSIYSFIFSSYNSGIPLRHKTSECNIERTSRRTSTSENNSSTDDNDYGNDGQMHLSSELDEQQHATRISSLVNHYHTSRLNRFVIRAINSKRNLTFIITSCYLD